MRMSQQTEANAKAAVLLALSGISGARDTVIGKTQHLRGAESPYTLMRYIVAHAFPLMNTRAARYVDDRAGHRRAPLQKQDGIGDLIGLDPAA